MNPEIDAGHVALALAQTTLSMLTAAHIVEAQIVQAAASAIEGNGSLGLSSDEMAKLVDILRESAIE